MPALGPAIGPADGLRMGTLQIRENARDVRAVAKLPLPVHVMAMSRDDVTTPESTTNERLSIRCRVVQSPGVLAAASQGEVLLIREETADCYALRGAGVDIWEAARRPAAIRDICETLLRTYAVDAETCETTVLTQVEELLDQGLFVRAG